MGNEEGEGGRAREKERMRGSKQEPGTEAKTGSRIARNEPGHRQIKGQLTNWLCRHSLSTAVFLGHVLQHTWQAQNRPQRNQVVLERVATEDRVGQSWCRSGLDQSHGWQKKRGLVNGQEVPEESIHKAGRTLAKGYMSWVYRRLKELYTLKVRCFFLWRLKYLLLFTSDSSQCFLVSSIMR